MTTCRYINSGQSNFEFEYIGEFETEFYKFLEYESGAQVGSIDRKKQRAKISCYGPFKEKEGQRRTQPEEEWQQASGQRKVQIWVRC